MLALRILELQPRLIQLARPAGQQQAVATNINGSNSIVTAATIIRVNSSNITDTTNITISTVLTLILVIYAVTAITGITVL